MLTVPTAPAREAQAADDDGWIYPDAGELGGSIRYRESVGGNGVVLPPDETGEKKPPYLVEEKSEKGQWRRVTGDKALKILQVVGVAPPSNEPPRDSGQTNNR